MYNILLKETTIKYKAFEYHCRNWNAFLNVCVCVWKCVYKTHLTLSQNFGLGFGPMKNLNQECVIEDFLRWNKYQMNKENKKRDRMEIFFVCNTNFKSASASQRRKL